MTSAKNDDLDVRPGPNRYVSHVGAALHIGRFLEDYRSPAIVTGQDSWKAFDTYVTAHHGVVPLTALERYDGSATERNARQIAAALPDRTDAIVAIGGGKLSDTAKNVAQLVGCDLIVVPTLAATCSAYTPVSVNYDEQHRYASSPLHSRATALTIVDPALIATGPRRFLIGGIGDTLAKWYESVPIFARLERTRGLGDFERLAQLSARLIRDILIENADKGLQQFDALHHAAVGDADITDTDTAVTVAGATAAAAPQLKALIDAIIGVSGTVGGFGGASARASGAHAVHDALTLLPESQLSTHGEKVAYGHTRATGGARRHRRNQQAAAFLSAHRPAVHARRPAYPSQ
ncbi:iron-containing alcohol dehydrogenase [Pseudoscardovia suis]|uniref:Glycerol dehydrogenase n=1 Tax=Pseudoscardovia suis TaxID=987063 RepID=A0A261F1D8_9BIFI|nr:iron-containing alcohol dehydrogenase [Pseudoscardovia suis]OZG52883.1 glycerol dehydrogenase [Pseudoscardovia suis]PJJ68388.1 putative oxidoreductase [Pseudoscardovia suis]